MEATPKIEGTTLAVLQAYPLGSLEVEIIAGARKGERHTVIGLDCVENFGVMCGGPFKRIATLHECCLPVLRPFSALCEPLADGTVPAVEVAKLVLDLTLDHCDDYYLSALTARFDDEEGYVGEDGDSIIECIVEDNTGAQLLTIYSDFLVSASDTLIPVEAYDYLRANHFALPVNGRPLVEGVDFIAKAGLPAIQEGSQPQAT